MLNHSCKGERNAWKSRRTSKYFVILHFQSKKVPGSGMRLIWSTPHLFYNGPLAKPSGASIFKLWLIKFRLYKRVVKLKATQGGSIHPLHLCRDGMRISFSCCPCEQDHTYFGCYCYFLFYFSWMTSRLDCRVVH